MIEREGSVLAGILNALIVLAAAAACGAVFVLLLLAVLDVI